MPVKWGLEVLGYQYTLHQLKRLEPNVRLKVLRSSTRAGAKVLQKEVKSRLAAHYLSGELQQSVRVRAAKDVRGKRLNRKHAVGHAVETPVFYARFLEFGTKHQTAEDIFSRSMIAKKAAVLREFKRQLKAGVIKFAAEKRQPKGAK